MHNKEAVIEEIFYLLYKEVLPYAEAKKLLVEIYGDENKANEALLGADWYDFTDD